MVGQTKFNGTHQADGISKYELLKKVLANRFDLSNEFDIPEPIIQFKGKPLATKQNLVSVVGAAKSGKSGVCGAILGACINPNAALEETFGFEVKPNTEGHAILHIDTEQANWKHHQSMARVMYRAGQVEQPNYFHSHSVRSFTIGERLEGIKLLLEHYKQKNGGIYLLFIDGVTDLLNSVLDEKENITLVNTFERISIDYNTTVILVIHTNPKNSGGNGRGHIGGELTRKVAAELNITKSKDSEISTIEFRNLRDAGGLPKIDFQYDERKGYHVFIRDNSKEGIEQQKVNEKRKRLEELCKKIFNKDTNSLPYKELLKKIKKIEGVKDRAAIGRVSDMKAFGIIEVNKNKEYEKNILTTEDHPQVPF